MSEVITASGLRKSFKARGKLVEAVRGVSFSVSQGEIFGFLGPNGAGKTTTLRMLTTLLPIDAGEATVAGLDVVRAPARVRQRIGYVSQLGGADLQATGRENLVLQGRLYGSDRAEVAARVEELLGLLDLASFADRLVKTYSGGQRRRLDVALGIVHQPEVLFLDEPTTGLDPQNRANLWQHVSALRDRGVTVFLTTHYLEEADALCDRVMIIDGGTIVAEGTTRELKRDIVGESVVLRVADEDGALERVSALLEQAPFVRSTVADDDGQLRCYVDDGAAALPDLLRRLDGAKIALRSISLSEPTLDDVFLAKTGHSLRDAGAPGGAGA
ncbi:MAG: ATP-binding cassette domain-containing protein [Solirubrobacteraceae bacterium]